MSQQLSSLDGLIILYTLTHNNAYFLLQSVDPIQLRSSHIMWGRMHALNTLDAFSPKSLWCNKSNFFKLFYINIVTYQKNKKIH